MCCQDGDPAIWQMLHEPAGWSPEAEDDFSPHEQPGAEELPTAAAELIIRLVATPRTGRPLGTVPHRPARKPDGIATVTEPGARAAPKTRSGLLQGRPLASDQSGPVPVCGHTRSGGLVSHDLAADKHSRLPRVPQVPGPPPRARAKVADRVEPTLVQDRQSDWAWGRGRSTRSVPGLSEPCGPTRACRGYVRPGKSMRKICARGIE
jgi:hypothetical protein